MIQSVQCAELKNMMGHRQVEQAALFYEFSLERHIPADHLLRSIDRFVELDGLRHELATVLQQDRKAIDRSRADDPDAHHRLLLRHTLGATPVRGGPPQSGVSVILPPGARRRSSRPLHLLEEPAWPL